jgi:hypothetical protein
LKQGWLVLAAIAILVAGGCRRKPAYENINLNQSRTSVVQDSTNTAANSNLSTGAESQPTGNPPQAVKRPPFLDPMSGEITDLPSFPDSRLVGASFGPYQGTQMAMRSLMGSGDIQKAVEFYQAQIKKYGWTVSDYSHDQSTHKWTLTRGDRDHATVQLEMDTDGRHFGISLLRTSLEPEQPK